MKHVFLVFTLLLLTACSAQTSDSPAEQDTLTDSNTAGDLIIARISDISSLDPHGSNDSFSGNVQKNIYETLVNRSLDNEIVPGLAASWERNDELTWTFKLHENITFHDGSPFNADVVKMNLDRVRDAKIASPKAFLFEMVEDVTVIDPYTVQLKTTYTFSPLLAHLTHSGGAIISGEVITADNEAVAAGQPVGSYINEHPYGTGFFKWEAWTPGSEVRLVRNEDYWGTPAGLASVTFKVVPDSTVRLAELETGYAHIIDPVQPIEVSQIEQSGTSSVVRQSASGISYLGYHVEKPPFDDVRVRQAINMAIDKTALVDGIYEGYAVEAIGPLGPDIFGYTKELDVPAFNIEQAKQLLADAGYKDGFTTSIWTYDDPQRVETAIVLQEALKQININAKVEVIELGAYLDKTANGDHEMFILGWSNPTGDADYGMYGLFHSSQFGTAGNRSFYANEKVDKLLDEARVEGDETKRLAIYRDAQQALIDDAAVGYLLHSEYLIGVNNNVKGFVVDNASLYHLHDVTLAP